MHLGKHFAAVAARYVGNEVSDGSYIRARSLARLVKFQDVRAASKLHDGPRTKRTN